jgi:hypothetical protein
VEANLESLAMGLRIKDDHLIKGAFLRLGESATFFKKISNHLLATPRSAFMDPLPAWRCMDMAVACDLARSHALMLSGHNQEAKQIVSNLKSWHETLLNSLEAPINAKAIWLARVPDECLRTATQMMEHARAVPEGFEYVRNTIEFCEERHVSPSDIAALSADAPILVLS